jgi:hypothetical protein
MSEGVGCTYLLLGHCSRLAANRRRKRLLNGPSPTFDTYNWLVPVSLRRAPLRYPKANNYVRYTNLQLPVDPHPGLAAASRGFWLVMA